MYITQCIIAKNEEDNIGYCLSHLKSVVDEQIVVDTGSTDRTVEIAKELGAKAFHFDWIDDFSAARNFALEKAKGDWIIFIDCDEYFSDESISMIRENIKRIHGNRNINGIKNELINIDKDKNVLSTTKNISPRIFRNRKSIRYTKKIHEYLIDTKNIKNEYTVACIDGNDIKIMHTGYDQNIAQKKNKKERNVNMLKKELDENPTDSHLNLYVSNSLYMNQQYSEALHYALQALKHMDSNKNLDYYPNIFSSILYAMQAIGSTQYEMKSIFDEAINKYPEYPDYYGAMGLAAINDGDAKDAIEYLENCIYYCNNYSGNIESLALGQIERFYNELLKAYILEDNKPKIVEISVALLNADKYDYENLSVLIITLLSQEKEEAIIEFLAKIYDYNNIKDKVYLLKSSEVSKNEKLIEYYNSLFDEKEIK